MNFSLQTPQQSATHPRPETSELPPLDRPSRRRKGGRKIGVILAVLVVGGGATASFMNANLRKSFAGLFKPASTQVIRYRVTRTKLPVTVVERGNLESAKNQEVLNEVEGQTTIIMILPEGKEVKKGELVAELDSATLRDNLVNQEITTRRAKADLDNAEKTKIVAQISKREYLEGTFPQDIQTIEGEIKLAQSDRLRAADRLDWSQKMLKMSYVPENTVLADKMTMDKSEISLKNSQLKLKVLMEFTKEKQVTELEANIKKAESDEFAKQQTYALEKAKEEKISKQIIKCKLYAPGDGLIVYANDPNQNRGSNQVQIEEGATVRERQKIFKLPDITNMRVNTKVHESMVDRVTKGLPARIKVDALPNLNLSGKVQTVQPLPDSGGFMASDVKQYTTFVSIDDSNPGLRPGMTAQVEILVTQLDDVLTVPVTAILQAQGKDYVFVMKPEGPERKEVTLGITNQKHIEIKEGLKEGEEVALNWSVLLSEQEKNTLFNATTKKATNGKDWTNVPDASKAKIAPGLGGGPADAKGGAAAKGGDPKAKAKGGARPKMFPDDPALQKKVDAIPRAEMRKLFMGSEEEKSALFKGAGFTEDEIKKYQDAMAERMKNMPAGGFGGPGGGGGGPGGGGGGPGGGGGGRPGGGGGIQ